MLKSIIFLKSNLFNIKNISIKKFTPLLIFNSDYSSKKNPGNLLSEHRNRRIKNRSIIDDEMPAPFKQAGDTLTDLFKGDDIKTFTKQRGVNNHRSKTVRNDYKQSNYDDSFNDMPQIEERYSQAGYADRKVRSRDNDDDYYPRSARSPPRDKNENRFNNNKDNRDNTNDSNINVRSSIPLRDRFPRGDNNDSKGRNNIRDGYTSDDNNRLRPNSNRNDLFDNNNDTRSRNSSSMRENSSTRDRRIDIDRFSRDNDGGFDSRRNNNNNNVINNNNNEFISRDDKKIAYKSSDSKDNKPKSSAPHNRERFPSGNINNNDADRNDTKIKRNKLDSIINKENNKTSNNKNFFMKDEFDGDDIFDDDDDDDNYENDDYDYDKYDRDVNLKDDNNGFYNDRNDANTWKERNNTREGIRRQNRDNTRNNNESDQYLSRNERIRADNQTSRYLLDKTVDFKHDSFQGTRLFVSNIPKDVDWMVLKDHFRSSGSVIYASISTDRITNMSKGSGIVQFETKEQAEQAIIDLDGMSLRGVQLHVRKDLQQLNKRIENKNSLINNKTYDKVISRDRNASKISVNNRDINYREEYKDNNNDHFWDENTPWIFDTRNSQSIEDSVVNKIQEQVTLRQSYRNKKNPDYQKADEIRKDLEKKYKIVLNDKKRVWTIASSKKK